MTLTEWCSWDSTRNNFFKHKLHGLVIHYSDVIMSAMASQVTGVSIVCLIVCSGVDQRKHRSSASRAFVRGIHRWPEDSPHKGSVTRKMFPFDEVIMDCSMAKGTHASVNYYSCRVVAAVSVLWCFILVWYRLGGCLIRHLLFNTGRVLLSCPSMSLFWHYGSDTAAPVRVNGSLNIG